TEGEVEPASHTTGEGADTGPHEARETEPVGERLAPLLRLPPSQTGEPAEKDEVLRCREVGVDGGWLAGDGEESLRLGGVGVHIDIHDPDGAGVGAEQGGEDVDAGRLLGSVAAEQGEHLAPVDL